MKGKGLVRNPYFWSVLAIIIATIVIASATYTRFLQLHFYVGPLYFHHWLGWTGSLFIAIYTPIYHFLKRRYPARYKHLLNLHVFGNLVAFFFISVHFAQHMGRPAEFFPDLGTGLALYITLGMLVVTGILQRFKILEKLTSYYKFIHTGLTMTFYILIVIHILHGLEII
jgi:hypothetical protein